MNKATLSRLLEQVVQGFCRLKNMGEVDTSGGEGFAIHFEEWEWEVGVGLYGFWQYARQQNDASLQRSILTWYEDQLAKGLPEIQINTTAPMITLALVAGHSGRDDLLKVVNDWADSLLRTLPKTEEGGFQHVVKEQPNTGHLWDDTLFMTCLFLGTAGVVLKRKDLIDEASYQFLQHTRYLCEPASGLWYHGWTFEGNHNYAEAFWARGNCWLTIAIPEIIEILELSKEDALRKLLIETLEAQVRALKTYQSESGLWHTLLDDPSSYVESSATAGFAYGILKAVHKRYLPQEYKEVAYRAIQGLLEQIDEKGEVQNVSIGTGMGDSLDFYRNIGITAMPYGQSLTVLCLTELLVSYC